MFIFYALFYLSDSLNNKHVLFTHTCLVFKTTLTEHILQTFIFKKKMFLVLSPVQLFVM